MRKFQRSALYSTILFCCFLIGVIGGCVLAALNQPSAAMQSLLNDHFVLIADNKISVPILSVILNCIRWPIIVVTASLLPCPTLVIPALLALRGLCLSYTTTCLCASFRIDGLTLSATLFSSLLIFELPALFILSNAAFCGAASASDTHNLSYRQRIHAESLAIASGFLLAAIAMHLTAIPSLFSAVCLRLFT